MAGEAVEAGTASQAAAPLPLLDPAEAFRPSSPYFGAVLCPAAAVVGRIYVDAKPAEPAMKASPQ